MPSYAEISAQQLSRLVGLPKALTIIDVRMPEDFDADPRTLPTTIRRDHRTVHDWAGEYAGQDVVVVCQKGLKLSQGAAAWLRHAGANAEVLEGGFEAWRGAAGLLVKTDKVKRGESGCTQWVTRARPKIDRIACPWLVRRFIDPKAVFLFVAPSEVGAVAERFDAIPFDIDNVFWSHRGSKCTFDIMLEEFGLRSEALVRLAAIVNAADTGNPDAAPQAAGLLAASLGLSRMYRDDIEQLEASLLLYDAFYRWCRDAVGETHDWPTNAKAAP